MPRPSRCALRVRADLPGFVECTSVCMQRTRAHRARAPMGFPSGPRRGIRDPRSQARLRARSRASKSERCISAVQVPCPCRRSNAKAQRRVLTLLRHLVSSRTYEALDLRSIRIAAVAAATPVGSARRIAPIPLSAHTDVQSAEHRPRPRTFRRSRKARCQGVLSLGDFALHAHCAAGAARTAKVAAKRRRAGFPESRKVTLARPKGK